MPLSSRRQILRVAVGSAAGVAFRLPGLRFPDLRAQTIPPERIGSLSLGDGLHLLTAGGINVVARTDANGVLLVDGGAAETAEIVLETVAKLSPNGKIHTLFNTHWHAEQTGLNEPLGREGATIIAQENTRLWLTTDITYPWDGQHFEPLPAHAQPNQTFYDEGELDTGIRYGYLRHAAHTDGDLYVYFPDANVLAVGDAVSGAGWPFVDWWTGGWIGGIVGGLELLLSLTDAETRIVPSRGRLLSKSDLETQYEMYNTVYERLAGLLNSGRGTDEAVAARPTEEFDGVMGPSEEFVRQAFQSLWAYLSPDA